MNLPLGTTSLTIGDDAHTLELAEGLELTGEPVLIDVPRQVANKEVASLWDCTVGLCLSFLCSRDCLLFSLALVDSCLWLDFFLALIRVVRVITILCAIITVLVGRFVALGFGFRGWEFGTIGLLDWGFVGRGLGGIGLVTRICSSDDLLGAISFAIGNRLDFGLGLAITVRVSRAIRIGRFGFRLLGLGVAGLWCRLFLDFLLLGLLFFFAGDGFGNVLGLGLHSLGRLDNSGIFDFGEHIGLGLGVILRTLGLCFGHLALTVIC
jgi:hypothetical protein